MNRKLVVYLAAPWADRAEAREVRDIIQSHDIEVNSRWLDTHHTTEEEATHEVLAVEAMHDVEDVLNCDILMLWNTQKSEGKAVETGMALIAQKGIILIGDKTNVFHHLDFPQVDTLENAIITAKNYPWRPGQEPQDNDPLFDVSEFV
jgi:hypothetical protein